MNMLILLRTGCAVAALVAMMEMSGLAAELAKLGDQHPNASPAKPLPRVLLIGDSIRGGYGKGVQQLLAGKAEVLMNPGNAEYTGTGLKKIDEWLGDGKWAVIHFNLETFKGVQWVAGYHSPADFNPGGKVDTDAWADAAVSAGMKYAVLRGISNEPGKLKVRCGKGTCTSTLARGESRVLRAADFGSGK